MNHSNSSTYIGPHGHDYSEIYRLIKSFSGQTIVCIPNAGNAGDAFINLGMYQLLEATGVEWEIGLRDLSYPNRVIVHSGGGSLVDEYPGADAFIQRNHAICHALILLPHTVRGHIRLLQSLSSNCHLFARERNSFNFIKEHAIGGARTYIGHDMAFVLEKSMINKLPISIRFLLHKDIIFSWPITIIKIMLTRIYTKKLSVIRIDSESTDLAIPHKNFDLSTLFSSGHLFGTSLYMSPGSCASTAKAFSIILQVFDIIETNRLHVAIMSAIFGSTVTMRDNSYGKNRDVFLHSINDYFYNVNFVEV